MTRHRPAVTAAVSLALTALALGLDTAALASTGRGGQDAGSCRAAVRAR